MGVKNSKPTTEQLNTTSKSKVLESNPILKTMSFQKRVDQLLKINDIKEPILQFIYQKNLGSLVTELDNKKVQEEVKTYEHDLTLAFWFAVHLEDLKIAQALLNRENLIKQLVACALFNEKAPESSDSEEDDDSKEDMNENDSQQSFKSANLSEEEKSQNKQKRNNNGIQNEGGEDEDDSFDDDNDEDDEESQISQEESKVEPKRNENIQEFQQPISSPKQENLEAKKDPPKKSLGQVLSELKQQKEQQQKLDQGEFSEEDEENDNIESFKAIGITEDLVERASIQDMNTLLTVKKSFRTKFYHLMTNVLKIALQKDEEKIACLITAYYEVALEEEMIVRAISKDNYQWLLFVWGFDKNYIGYRNNTNALFISFEQLFELIKKQHQNDMEVQKERIKRILDWRIITTDNILIALLAHNYDDLAIQHMGYFSHQLDKELFVFCMTHGNNYFLQKALLLVAFDKMIFREDAVIHQILNILKQGYRTNFLMNILALIDISVWKNQHLKELIDIITDYVEENYDKNRLLLSPNPVMSIALAAEILKKIATARRKFENECIKVKGQLMSLGKMYSSKIEDEVFYEKLISQEDFKGRSVLKIITQNDFESLMDENDPKAENLMLMIWNGKEATRCDGNIYGYSNLAHIITSKAKKISGKKSTLMQMITNYFEPNFKVDYSFQYRYRSKAISFYFMKEFLCALAMLIIFQYINYQYLVLFSTSYIKDSGEDRDAQIETIEDSISEYIDWNFYALFFSAALIFQFLLKILFNICSKSKIPIDKWTIMDTLSAILNIAAVLVIKNINPASLLEALVKDIVDYFMILVLGVSWLRFFTYFLVVRPISRLLLTLVAMIGDTLSFMFIVSCFILIMASIFTTLYQDTNPELYGGLAITVRTLFDAALGEFDNDADMGDRVISHSLLQTFHIFMANVLLMNYLIAILSTTYENMQETGIFRYKVNLFQYCERFMIAFNDRAYGEMVLHPPPLSYLACFMVPFTACQNIMPAISKIFSYFMFWLENIVFILCFFMFELVLFPFAYIKVWFNIVKNSMGIGKTIGNCIVWAIIGIIMMFFIIWSDCFNILRILMHHEGCRYGMTDELDAGEVDKSYKMKLYNEVRATVISLYKRLKSHMKQGDTQEDENQDEDDIEEDPDFFHIDDEDSISEEFLYVVKKSLIIDEWKKRKYTLVKQERIREQRSDDEGDSGIKAKLVQSLRKKLQQSSTVGNHTKSSYNKNESFFNKQSPVAKQSTNSSKPKDLTNQMKVIFLDTLKKTAEKEEETEVDMSDFEIQDWEVKIVDDFLTKFTIVSESSMNEHLDIMLMLKALPNKIMPYTIDITEQYNFRIFQESLIAFQNLDIVNAFEYFDDKNRERVQNVKDKLMNQRNNLSDVKDILELVKIKIERNEEFFTKQQNLGQNSQGNNADSNMPMLNLMGQQNNKEISSFE